MFTRDILYQKLYPILYVAHPPPSSAEVKETVELYLYSTSAPSWPVAKRILTLLYLFWKILSYKEKVILNSFGSNYR